MLELGVLTATGALATMRTMARVAVTTVDDGPYARTTKARRVKARFDRKVRYQVDGGDRETVRKLTIEVIPGGLTVCVPPAAG
jgi:diacylglycerol kinase family enzyme